MRIVKSDEALWAQRISWFLQEAMNCCGMLLYIPKILWPYSTEQSQTGKKTEAARQLQIYWAKATYLDLYANPLIFCMFATHTPMLLKSCEVKCKPQSVDLAEILGQMSEIEPPPGLVTCSKPGAESDSANLKMENLVNSQLRSLFTRESKFHRTGWRLVYAVNRNYFHLPIHFAVDVDLTV